MKRLILGFTVVMAIVGLSSAGAQASTLSVKEAKQAAIDHSMDDWNGMNFPWVEKVNNCARLSPERIRCSVKVTHETYWKLKSCNSRVEISDTDEIRVSTLRKKCRMLDRPFLSWQRAQKVALKAMDPNATRYSTGGGGSSDGKNRHQIEAEWEFNGQTCMQTARVKLLGRKVLVNVSEVSCVDIPDWPKSRSA